MKYKVDKWNNFCWVFEMFCTGLGIKLKMVDRFEPVQNVGSVTVSKDEKFGEIETAEIDHEIHSKLMGEFLRRKAYVKPDRKYLVLTSFSMLSLRL